MKGNNRSVHVPDFICFKDHLKPYVRAQSHFKRVMQTLCEIGESPSVSIIFSDITKYEACYLYLLVSFYYTVKRLPSNQDQAPFG